MNWNDRQTIRPNREDDNWRTANDSYFMFSNVSPSSSDDMLSIRMKLPFSLPLALTLALIGTGALQADDAAVASKLAKIPPAAAEALKKSAGTATIGSLSIEKDGKVTVYLVTLSEPGKPEREVSVTADGKLDAEEETVPLEKVPEAARKAIEDHAKGAKIERVQRIQRAAGGVTYEALYVVKGKKSEIEFLENGQQKPEEK